MTIIIAPIYDFTMFFHRNYRHRNKERILVSFQSVAQSGGPAVHQFWLKAITILDSGRWCNSRRVFGKCKRKGRNLIYHK